MIIIPSQYWSVFENNMSIFTEVYLSVAKLYSHTIEDTQLLYFLDELSWQYLVKNLHLLSSETLDMIVNSFKMINWLLILKFYCTSDGCLEV